jgi:hypothetical protein
MKHKMTLLKPISIIKTNSMKKIFISTLLIIFCGTLVFASDVEGKWNASIDTNNGVWEFSVVYKVSGEKISGEFITERTNMLLRK